MEPNKNEKFPGSESITGYKAWQFFDEFISYALDDLARERNISKAEMLRIFTSIPFGKNIGKANPQILLAFGVSPDQITMMFDENEAEAEKPETLPTAAQPKEPVAIKGKSILLEPASDETIDGLKEEYKSLPGYIDYALSKDEIVEKHSELSKSKIIDLTMILSKFKDENPRNYTIKTLTDSETVGYLQLMQADTVTPSVSLYIRDDARGNGYGYDALMAMIAALKEESMYAALYFVANAADTASVHLAEKSPLPKKTLECSELEQFVRVYRIEL